MDLSVVCPYYNESAIIGQTVRAMLARLETLDCEWELIVVNDGSIDDSAAIVGEIDHPRLRPIGYRFNRGRGHGLRTGIAAARGELLVTTEIDLSWGENIVQNLMTALEEWPDADIIVASPHLEGGGYANVPRKRVLISRFGNRVIRACMSNAVTMNTGMTRGYRRSVIQALPLFEDGKEFHLEVILKATALGYRIREIPATLEWKEWKRQGKPKKRKSSSKVPRLILSHTLFSVFANPVRYVWMMSFGSAILSLVSLVIAIVLAALERVSVYMALMSLSLMILAIMLFVLGVVVKQGNMVQRELWQLQSEHLKERNRRRDG